MFKTILCPTDFSGLSHKALDTAHDMSKRYGAKLMLISVVELDPMMDNSAVPVAELEAETERKIAQLAKKEVDAGYQVEWVVYQGMPEESIIEHAAKHNVDLIIMGSHGRRGLKRLLMGSVAESVVRRAQCPVMVVKEK
ncbi:MAG: universal stress protein [Chloroherpetonaceae bacterium]|nr:universal stress protein [Chloroherpetonaceae bacterium]